MFKKNVHLVNKSNSTSTETDWKKESIEILTGRRSRIIFVVLIALIFLRLGINWIFRTRIVDEVPRVTVINPSNADLNKDLSLPGNIEAIEQANLFAHVGGYLKKIYVDEGDHVKKGQLLAEIDAPDIVQEFRKAKAEWDLKNTTNNRYKELLKEQVISQQEYDNVEADANESKARYDNAEANVSFTHITAPFAGSIARRFKYPGDLISTGTRGDEQPLFLLVNEKKLRVAINVPQIDVSDIKIDDAVDIRVDAFPKQTFSGKVSRLDALMDDATKTQRVLIDLDNQNELLHAGMFASVVLHVSHLAQAFTIPKDCMRDENGHHYVFVVKNDKAIRQEVTVGVEQDNRIQILQGVTPSDQVVVLGSAILADQAPVKILGTK